MYVCMHVCVCMCACVVFYGRTDILLHPIMYTSPSVCRFVSIVLLLCIWPCTCVVLNWLLHLCVSCVCVCVLSHMCCFLSVICTYGDEHLRLHICFCICVVGNVLFHGCHFVCVVAYVCLAAGIGERHGLGQMPPIISGKKRGRKRSAVNVLITLMHTNRC